MHNSGNTSITCNTIVIKCWTGGSSSKQASLHDKPAGRRADGLAFLLARSRLRAQAPTGIACLNQHIIPITAVRISNGFANLAPLCPVVGFLKNATLFSSLLRELSNETADLKGLAEFYFPLL